MIAIKMPKRSVVVSSVAAILAWMLTSWLQIRPLGILVIAFFIWWIYQTQCHLRITPPPELIEKFNNLVNYMSEMRRVRHGLFCAVSCSALAMLAVLGHYVSGSSMLLVMILLGIVIVARYNFKLTPIAQTDYSWAGPSNETDLDEQFLPEVNESDLCVLERASTLASLSSNVDEQGDDDKSDEIPSDLLLPDKLPEINEHTDEEDDLVPLDDKSKPLQSRAPVLDATTAAPHSMEFKKGHFKRDSSMSTSSSEESLSKGLKFPDHTTVDGPSSNSNATDLVGQALRSQTQALIANSANMLMTGLVQWGMGTVASDAVETKTPTVKVTSITEIPNTTNAERRLVTALDSSDESDFEILENEDFK